MSVVIAQNTASTTHFFSLGEVGVDDAALAQSFNSAITAVLDSCSVRLLKQGSPTGPMTCSLYAHTGVFGTSSKPTGSALSTSDVRQATVVTNNFPTEVNYTFTFSGSNRYTMVAGTKYCISINFSNGNFSNFLIVCCTDDVCPGNLSDLPDGINWDADPGLDLVFSVSGIPTNQNAKRDQNHVPTLIAVSSADGLTIDLLQVNPTSNGLKVSDDNTGVDHGTVNVKRDENSVPCIMGVSSDDFVTPVAIYTDGSGSLLIQST